jgi:uncharacterized Zn finger protein (UPF0148 family)
VQYFMAKHFCPYCGLEYDPAESMCPACGYRNITIKEEKKPVIPLFKKKEKHKERTYEKKLVPTEKKKESVMDKPPGETDRGKIADKKDVFYKKALEKLERSLHKAKGSKEKVGSFLSKVSKVCAIPFNILLRKKISYIFWFLTGLSIISSFTGYRYSSFSWYEKSMRCLFTSDRILHARFANVNHEIDRLISPTSFHIIHADVHLGILILSCLVPAVLWFIKIKVMGSKKAGDPNVLFALIVTLFLVIPVFIFLRLVSFEYIVFDILLGIITVTPLLDFGIFAFLSSSSSFKLNKAFTLVLYNCAIPIIFLVINMFFDYVR